MHNIVNFHHTDRVKGYIMCNEMKSEDSTDCSCVYHIAIISYSGLENLPPRKIVKLDYGMGLLYMLYHALDLAL